MGWGELGHWQAGQQPCGWWPGPLLSLRPESPSAARGPTGLPVLVALQVNLGPRAASRGLVCLSRCMYKCVCIIIMCHVRYKCRSSHRGAAETNPMRNHEVAGSLPGLAQRVKDLALP